MNENQIRSQVIVGALAEEIGGKALQLAQARAEITVLEHKLATAQARIDELMQLAADSKAADLGANQR